MIDKTGEVGNCAICGKESILIIDICDQCAEKEYEKIDKHIAKKLPKEY